MTQFVGENHELKYGLDFQEVEWKSDVRRPNLYSGQGNNLFSATSTTGYINPADPSQPAAPTAATSWSAGASCILQDYNHPSLYADLGSSDTKSTNVAAYVRDRFQVGEHWTFNVGLRYENQKHENDIGREVMDSGDFSPRGSVSYDLKGDGRQLLTASLGRTYNYLPQEAVHEFMIGPVQRLQRLRAAPLLLARQRRLGNAGSGGSGSATPAAIPAWATPRRSASCSPACSGTWSTPAIIDSDLEAYHKDEAILGFEWQFSRNWALDAKAIWWEVDNLIGSTTQLARSTASRLLHPEREPRRLSLDPAGDPQRRDDPGDHRAHADRRDPRLLRGALPRLRGRYSSRSTAASPTTGRSTPT